MIVPAPGGVYRAGPWEGRGGENFFPLKRRNALKTLNSEE